MKAMEVRGRVHKRKARLERRRGRVVDAGGAAAAPAEVGRIVVGEAIRVPAQALHERGRRSTCEGTGAWVLPWYAHPGQTGLGRVQGRDKLGRVPGISSNDGTMVAHAGRRQGEDGVARLEGRHGGNVASRQGRLGFRLAL